MSAIHTSAIHMSAIHTSAIHTSAIHMSAIHTSAIHMSAIHMSAIHTSAIHMSAIHTSAIYMSAIDTSAINHMCYRLQTPQTTNLRHIQELFCQIHSLSSISLSLVRIPVLPVRTEAYQQVTALINYLKNLSNFIQLLRLPLHCSFWIFFKSVEKIRTILSKIEPLGFTSNDLYQTHALFHYQTFTN